MKKENVFSVQNKNVQNDMCSLQGTRAHSNSLEMTKGVRSGMGETGPRKRAPLIKFSIFYKSLEENRQDIKSCSFKW